MNNNLTPVSQPSYIETKADEHFSLVKPQFCHPNSEETTSYKSTFDFQDTKISYPVEENFQSVELFHTPKMYCKQSHQDEYIDLAQYNEYNSFLNVYDNQKIPSSEYSTMFNELDFRINSSCVPNLNNAHNGFSHDNFDVMSHQ